MRHLFLIMAALLCIPASVRAQTAPPAVTQAERVPFLAIQVVRDAEAHNGPGAHYAMVGWLPAGSIVPVNGCNADCSWLLIASAIWIAVDEAAPVIAFTFLDGTMGARAPAVANTFAQVPTATPVAAVFATETPSPSPTSTPTPSPLPSEMPTPPLAPTSVPVQSEIATVGQWVAATNEQKRATALLWSQRLASTNSITVSPELFANELFDCVDTAIGGSVEPFGESYSILDVAALCIATMESSVQSATPTALTPVTTYECLSDTYNCQNFTWHGAAQEAFEYCRNLGAGDVHDLDRDDDGVACEDLP